MFSNISPEARIPKDYPLCPVRIMVDNALGDLGPLFRDVILPSTKVVGAFPDGQSALMLCAARLSPIAGTQWGSKRYLNIDLLKEQEIEQLLADEAI